MENVGGVAIASTEASERGERERDSAKVRIRRLRLETAVPADSCPVESVRPRGGE